MSYATTNMISKEALPCANARQRAKMHGKGPRAHGKDLQHGKGLLAHGKELAARQSCRRTAKPPRGVDNPIHSLVALSLPQPHTHDPRAPVAPSRHAGRPCAALLLRRLPATAPRSSAAPPSSGYHSFLRLPSFLPCASSPAVRRRTDAMAAAAELG
jgi:hypothetical protein